MKEIKEEIIKKEYVTRWEAVDGTVFESKEQCKIYDGSAKAIILGRLKKLQVCEKESAWDLMGGDEEHPVVGFKATTEKERDIIMQFIHSEMTWLRDERILQIEGIVDNALENNDIILFGRNCDGDYYFINSRMNIVNNLMGLDKVESKPEPEYGGC